MTARAESWTAYAARAGLLRDRDRDPTDGRAAVGRPDGVWEVLDNSRPPHKYHAIPVHVDGVRFASRKEAARYLELRLLAKAGRIEALECQPRFPLHVMELWRSQAPIVITRIGTYTADFRYVDRATGEIVVEDVKSEATKTEAYKLRKKLAECIHGLTVTEV